VPSVTDPGIVGPATEGATSIRTGREIAELCSRESPDTRPTGAGRESIDDRSGADASFTVGGSRRRFKAGPCGTERLDSLGGGVVDLAASGAEGNTSTTTSVAPRDASSVKESARPEDDWAAASFTPAPRADAAGTTAGATPDPEPDGDADSSVARVDRLVAMTVPGTDEGRLVPVLLVPERLPRATGDGEVTTAACVGSGAATDSEPAAKADEPTCVGTSGSEAVAETVTAVVTSTRARMPESVGVAVTGALAVAGVVATTGAAGTVMVARALTPAWVVVSSATKVSAGVSNAGGAGITGVGDETGAELSEVLPGVIDAIGMTASAGSGPGSNTGIGSRGAVVSPLSTGPLTGMRGYPGPLIPMKRPPSEVLPLDPCTPLTTLNAEPLPFGVLPLEELPPDPCDSWLLLAASAELLGPPGLPDPEETTFPKECESEDPRWP
jgi:hypothetical protein